MQNLNPLLCHNCGTPKLCAEANNCIAHLPEGRDLILEPGLKPQGDTGMPDFVWAEEPTTSPARPVNHAHVVSAPTLEQSLQELEKLKEAPSEAFLQTLVPFTQDEQEIILAWYPHLYLRPSAVLGGQIVTTAYTMLEHAKALAAKELLEAKQSEKIDKHQRRAERRIEREEGSAFAEQWRVWQDQCVARKEWIARLNADWRKRVKERQTAIADWDAYVETAREALAQARDTLAPAMPKRNA